METDLEFLDEFLQLGGIDVANCPEFEALCVPTSNVESLRFVDLGALRFGRCSLRDEEIDHASGIFIPKSRTRAPPSWRGLV